MTHGKPRLAAGVKLVALPLTPEEAFVALRLDGATDTHGLSLVTGLPEARVTAALEKLASLGALLEAPAAAAKVAQEIEPPERPEEPADDSQAEEEPVETTQADDDAGDTHRELYERALHHLSADERAARAGTSEEPELSALCFDPLPAVIHALLDNPRFGPAQARLVASHHRTSSGLEALAARAALAADAGVRRALLRNPQLSTGLMRRLFGGRRLLELNQLAGSRDLPEGTRRTARELLRTRFSTADADERVEVIVKTEGRCLASLAGLPVDGKTASRLCGRTFTSTLLVQNIAHWAAAPPLLIAHLMKQDLVRRSPSLRMALHRHPNAPAEAKR
jgi:hypothetical protein